MKILVEFFGHSGLGKSSLAYSIAGRLKLNNISCELYVEEMKRVCLGLSDKTPKESREEDTNNIIRLSENYKVVVADTNPYSGYIFGDTCLEVAKDEASFRYSPFSKVIRVFLLPKVKFEIDSTGRRESCLNNDFMDRVERLSSMPNSIKVELEGHAGEKEFEHLWRELLSELEG